MKNYRNLFLMFLLFGAVLAFGPKAALAQPGESCGIQPVTICFMLDRTGSVLSGERQDEEDATNALIDDIASLGNGTRLIIGRFGDSSDGGTEAEIVDAEPNTGGTQTVTTDYAEAKLAVTNAMASSSSVGTNLADAINVCADALNNNDDGSDKYLVLISDGDPNEPVNPDTAALTAADNAKNGGITIFSIAFGTEGANNTDEGNRTLMAMVATQPSADDFCTNSLCGSTEIDQENVDQDHYFISPKTQEDLSAVFDAIFQFLQCEQDEDECTIDFCEDGVCVREISDDPMCQNLPGNGGGTMGEPEQPGAGGEAGPECVGPTGEITGNKPGSCGSNPCANLNAGTFDPRAMAFWLTLLLGPGLLAGLLRRRARRNG